MNNRFFNYRVLFYLMLSMAMPTQGIAEMDFDAEDLFFADIPSVFAASKYNQKVNTAPSSVSILTSEQIASFGYQTLGEALNAVPGFFNIDSRVYQSVGVRGFNTSGDFNTRILVLLDGKRVNDAALRSVFFDQAFVIDMSNVDRIEVVRGPSSALYGTSAFFAVVNVITKSGRQIGGSELTVQGGSRDTGAVVAKFGDRLKQGDLLVSANYLDANGDDELSFPGSRFDTPFTNNGVFEDADQRRTKKFFSKYTRGDLKVIAAASERTKRVPTSFVGTVFNDRNAIAEETTQFVNVDYSMALYEQLDWSVSISYDKTEWELAGSFYELDLFGNILGSSDGKVELDGQSVTVNTALLGKFGSHIVNLGVDYTDVFEQNTLIQIPWLPSFLTRKKDHDWGVYLQDDWSLTSSIALSLGLRHDNYGITNLESTSPRAGLVFTPSERIAVKALYGEAVRVPNSYELIEVNLKEEEIESIELIAEYYGQKGLYGSISVFENEVDDLIFLTLDPSFGTVGYSNIGQVRSRGVESLISGSLPMGIHGQFSHAYQDVVALPTETWFANSPRNIFKLHLDRLWFDRLETAFEVQYLSRRKSEKNTLISGRTVLNLTASMNLWLNGPKASISIYNLGDKQYTDPSRAFEALEETPREGRTFLATLKYTF